MRSLLTFLLIGDLLKAAALTLVPRYSFASRDRAFCREAIALYFFLLIGDLRLAATS